MRGTYVSGQYINFDGSKYYTSFDTASSPYGFALAMSNTTYAQGSDSNGYCALFSTDYKYDLLAQIRNNDAIKLSLSTIDKICELLCCQPGDIIEYVPDDSTAELAAQAAEVSKKAGV